MDLNLDKGEGSSSSPSTPRGASLSNTTPTTTHPLVVEDEPYGLYVAASQQLETSSQQLEPAPPLLLSGNDDECSADEIEVSQPPGTSATSSPGIPSGSSATRSSGLAIATTLTRLPYAAAPQPSRRPQAGRNVHAFMPRPAVDGNAQDEALRVRSNILRGMWQSLTRLWKPRLIMFLLRMVLSILQLVACLVVVALPSSLGNSAAGGDIDGTPPAPGSQCDPEPIFIYLVLYATRLVVLFPLDIYLTLSPHGNARQRRPGARNFDQRERNRTFGTLDRDRKVAKLVDLLSLAYCVLFVVGNWAVWTRTECSHRPADSLALFYTALSMLCLTYLYILVVLVITILIVFFLPLFLVILRVLGITRRLPQADIKPDTAKMAKDEVDKVTKLVYYVDEDEWLRMVRNSRQERSSLEQVMPFSAWTSELSFIARLNTYVASSIALPASPSLQPTAEEKEPVFLVHALPGTTVSTSTDKIDSDTSPSPGADANRSSAKAGAAKPHRSRARLGQMLSFGRRRARTRAAAADKTMATSSSPASVSMQAITPRVADAGAETTLDASGNFDTNGPASAAIVADADRRLRYPLHPLPSHRSVCPICLCDFESPLQSPQAIQVHQQSVSSSSSVTPAVATTIAEQGAGEEPEPLRLLPCQHVLHESCVDQWLTTVSGRCPICQRPVLTAAGEGEGEEEEGREAEGGVLGEGAPVPAVEV